MIVIGSLLGRFQNDLGVGKEDWIAGTPSYAGHSVGQIFIAAANSFRHADEWKKALFAKKITSKQQHSMSILKAALGLQTDYDFHNTTNICESIFDLIGNCDFDNIARSALTFANNLALQADRRLFPKA